MADYIRREDATLAVRRYARNAIDKKVKGLDVVDDVIGIVKELERVPAADVAEVVHGQWYLLDECANAGLYCSACSRQIHREEFAYKKLKSKYCPHCGAKMDGGAKND